MKASTLAIAMPLLVIASPVVAEDTEADGAEQKKDQQFQLIVDEVEDESIFEFSYSSPDSPALPLIGVEGDQIAKVDSLRKFGVSLGNAFSGNGDGRAIGIDFSPYWLFANERTSLRDYRTASTLSRIAARSKLGLAFDLGDKSTSRPSSFVVSLGTKLLDNADPILDLEADRCFLGKVKDLLRPAVLQRATNQATFVENYVAENHDGIARADGDETRYRQQLTREALIAYDAHTKTVEAENAREESVEAKAIAKAEEAARECISELGRRTAAASSFDVGIAQRLVGDPGELSNLKGSGTIIWGTFSSGTLGKPSDKGGAGPLALSNVRAAAHARYTLNEDVRDETTFALQGKRDSLMVVAGLESVPSPNKIERFRWGLQGGWNKQNAVLPTEQDKNFWRYQANVDLRITEGLWLTSTLGRVSGKGVDNDTKFLVGVTFSPPGRNTAIGSFFENRN